MPSILSSFLKSNHKRQWISWYLQKKFGRKIFGRTLDKYALRNIDGLYLILDNTSVVDQHLLKRGEWERSQIDVMTASFREYRNADSVFLDIGSYFGLYGLLAKKNGITEVHFVEPDQRNFSQLHAQLFLNEISSLVTVHNVAISNFIGESYFLHSEYIENGNRGRTGIASPGTKGSYVVNCTTLDSIFDFGEKIILIKMDIERNEVKALGGMTELVKKNRVFMQVESFEEEKDQFIFQVKNMGLRHIGSIYPDHYITNIDDKELSWFYEALNNNKQNN